MSIRSAVALALFLLAGFLGTSLAAMAQSTIHLEAESGALSGGAKEVSASGITYVTGFQGGHGLITFSGIAATAGPYELIVRYRAASGSENCSVSVNGSALSASFPVSANFYLTGAGEVSLGSANTITVGGGSGGYDIDYIELRPVAGAEAESGTLSGSAAVQTYSGASGGKVVSIGAATVGSANSGTTVTLSAAAGLYDLQIAYVSPYGQKGCNVSIDGGAVTTSFYLTSTTLATVDAGKVLLASGGSHTVFVGSGWGYYDLDKITLVPAAPDAPPLPVSDVPVDPAATAHAQALLAYLGDQYGGSRMVSGQHNLSEFPYLQQNTGQQPGILGVDLIDYSPSRTLYGGPIGSQYGAAPTVEPAIAQEQASGNILAVMWHWNAPDDLINTSSEEWWSGFYTAATTYNLATALANPDSNDYKLLIADLDTVAQQLQKFQEAGIPVLWRPLHEASGEFFWWGAQGSAPFNQLWKLIYDRFTGPLWNLHNLIWVYGGSDPSWYPGDSMVDIVGADIYDADVPTFEKDPTYTTWETYKQAFDGDKMIAATEVGGAPDAQMMHEYGVDWLYFMTWPGFDEQVPASQLKSVYNSGAYVNQPDLPAWPWNASGQFITKASVSGAQNATGNGWFTGAATVTLTAPSGAGATYYTVDTGAKTAYAGPFQVSGDGVHPVLYWSVDKSGDVEDAKARTILIDSAKPTSRCTSVAVNATGYQATLTASDATSGAQVIYYEIDGGAAATTTTFTSPIAVSGSGNHTLTFWSTDIAGNVEASHTIALNANSALTPSLTVSPSSVTGGQASAGKVTLSAAAPSGGVSVALASSKSSVASVPASVMVAAGSKSATFSVKTYTVAAASSATLSATISAGATAVIKVTPAAPAATLSSVALSPATVVGGRQNSTGLVTLTSPAPSGGASVTLASSMTSAATVPGSVSVAAGSTTASFTVASSKVVANASAAITATYSGTMRSAALAVTPTPPTSAVRFDFNGDGHADLIWYNTGSGGLSVWDMDDESVLSRGDVFAQLAPSTGWVPVAAPDVNGDGSPDVLWWNSQSGAMSVWTLSGTTVTNYGSSFATVGDTSWRPVAAADVDANGTAWELVFQNSGTGALSVWQMSGQTVISSSPTFASLGAGMPWQVVGAPDLDGDGHSDLLLWNSSTGEVSWWGADLAADRITSYNGDFTSVPLPWRLVGSEDTNGDGHPDLLWWNASTGELSRWLLSGTSVLQYGSDEAKVPDTTWQPTAIR